MHVHILGICGTFMAGIANLAKALGFTVTGQDENVYPPMSTLLEKQGIAITAGYQSIDLLKQADQIIVGNAMKRGLPVVEYLLDEKLAYCSGPQWLYQHILKDKTVIAIAGTHGKTTTSAMVAWILEEAGLAPGFLIGGVPENFGVSARLTDSPYFVIEADEYDTAFFDKRAKFIHYHPEYLSINNLEFDHADIYDNLNQIIHQFHGLIRMMPSKGVIVRPEASAACDTLFEKGLWSHSQTFGKKGDWSYELIKEDGSAFTVLSEGHSIAEINWSLLGLHNVQNALVAVSLSKAVGITEKKSAAALSRFKNVKRRLEKKGGKNEVILYDDFAHHPTAIATTIDGLRQHVGKEKIVVMLECASYTMRTGVHGKQLADALLQADQVYVLNDLNKIGQYSDKIKNCETTEEFFNDIKTLSGKVHLVTMSNKGVQAVHNRLLNEIL